MEGRAGLLALAAFAAAGAMPNVGGEPTSVNPSTVAEAGKAKQQQTPAQALKQLQYDKFLRMMTRRAGGGTNGVGGYLNRAGWTNRRYQRAALKRRNQQLNRKAHRG